MTLLGMDVDLVTGVATQLDGRAEAIGTATTDVDRLVDTAVSQWFGADAQKFVQEWQSQHRPALVAAMQALTQLSTTARRNVDEQRQASSGTGAAGGPAAASSPQCALTTDGKLDVCARTITSGATPTDVRSLLGLLHGAYQQPGGVSVTFTGTGADRHAIVTVSGTEDWGVGGTNVDDMSTNVSNAFGVSNLKAEAIQQAMISAGVTSTDKVLLVGHSQGGADVIDFAGNPAMAAKYDIAGVVTAGAPETVTYPNATIPVLELRTDGDVVPTLGAASASGLAAAGLPGAVIGHAVHDATMPDNVTVSELPGSWSLPWNAHKIDNYIAESAHISDPAVGKFVDAHCDFFSGAPATTYTYSAQRVGDGPTRYE